MFRKLFLILSIIFLISGCTQRVIDYTLISSKNIDLTHSNVFQKAKERVKGEDVAHIIIFIPTGHPNPKEAMDDAIEKIPGAVALVDGVVYNTFFYIPYVYGQVAWVVEGTPLIDTSLADNKNLKSNYIISFLNSETNNNMTAYTDQNTYEKIKDLIKKQDSDGITEILKKLQNV